MQRNALHCGECASTMPAFRHRRSASECPHSCAILLQDGTYNTPATHVMSYPQHTTHLTSLKTYRNCQRNRTAYTATVNGTAHLYCNCQRNRTPYVNWCAVLSSREAPRSSALYLLSIYLKLNIYIYKRGTAQNKMPLNMRARCAGTHTCTCMRHFPETVCGTTIADTLEDAPILDTAPNNWH